MDNERAIELLEEMNSKAKMRQMMRDMDGESTHEEIKIYRDNFKAIRMGIDALNRQKTMYEARIIYEDGRKYTLESENIEELKEKCGPWVDGPNVAEIQVVFVKEVGWFKSKVLGNVETL